MLSLHEIRMVKSITIIMLSRTTGVNSMIISRIERGCYPFRLKPDTAKRLSIGYGLSLKDFIETVRRSSKRGTMRISRKRRKDDVTGQE
ncbi:MAG: hypothetical protein JXA60_05235 [Candidatus Coatesbacteria bacterium]|nr:hypothetical protein [Candidatus Coatesbacteria bacterium]